MWHYLFAWDIILVMNIYNYNPFKTLSLFETLALGENVKGVKHDEIPNEFTSTQWRYISH